MFIDIILILLVCCQIVITISTIKDLKKINNILKQIHEIDKTKC